jgi:hypothetical protein
MTRYYTCLFSCYKNETLGIPIEVFLFPVNLPSLVDTVLRFIDVVFVEYRLFLTIGGIESKDF